MSILNCPSGCGSFKMDVTASFLLSTYTSPRSVSPSPNFWRASFFHFMLKDEADCVKLGTNHQYKFQRPIKDRISDTVVEYCNILMSHVVFGGTRSGRWATTRPRLLSILLKEKQNSVCLSFQHSPIAEVLYL